MKKHVWLLLAGMYHSEPSAKELGSVDVYEHSHRSVAILEERDDKDNLLKALTAIVIAKNNAVTLCDAQSVTHELRLLVDNKSVKTTVTARDSQRNLCLLFTPGAELPAIEIQASAAIQSGARVFALSNALGLGIGISEGVISGLRSQSGTDYIQFSAPVSPGSDGGALIDAEGRLLGVITYSYRDGQNVNFAIPAKWLAEIGQHDKSDADYKQFRETAEQLERQGLWSNLAEHTAKWLSLHQEDVDAWRWTALAADQDAKLDTEENAWQKLHELEPTSISAGAGLVKVKLKRGQSSEALRLAYALLSIRREDADIWAIIGQCEQAAGTAEKAQEAYRKALSFNPWQFNAYQGLIGIAEQQKDQRTVTLLWQRLASLSPDAAGIQLKLAGAYLSEGRFRRAYTLLQKMSVPEPQKADAAFLLGLSLDGLKRPLAASRAYQDSLKAEPSAKAWVYAAMGNSYFVLQRYPESIQAYTEAVRVEPDNSEMQYGLAKSLEYGGHAKEALVIYEQLVKKYPNNSGFWIQKAFTEGALVQTQACINSFEKSLELDPKQGRAWRALVGAYSLAGRDNDARSAYEKLRGIDSKLAEAAYRNIFLPFEDTQP